MGRYDCAACGDCLCVLRRRRGCIEQHHGREPVGEMREEEEAEAIIEAEGEANVLSHLVRLFM